MAGRPRTMAKRVGQLYEAYCGIAEELEKLMPQQYRQSTTDSLGQSWRTAVSALTQCDDYFCDLACLLDWKAKQAEERAATASGIAAVDTSPAELAVPLSSGSALSRACAREGTG